MPHDAERSTVPAPDRIAYAECQAQLLAALLHGGEPPEGFAVAQTAASGRSLRRKRGGLVARALPALALQLGDGFGERFDAYARETDMPAFGDPFEDGLLFARSPACDVRLGDDARAELLLARAALRGRGLFVRAAWLRRPTPRLLVVMALPGLGPRRLVVALRRGRAG